jgi:hypothetical protein
VPVEAIATAAWPFDAPNTDPDEGADLEQLKADMPQVAAAIWVCGTAMRRSTPIST